MVGPKIHGRAYSYYWMNIPPTLIFAHILIGYHIRPMFCKLRQIVSFALRQGSKSHFKVGAAGPTAWLTSTLPPSNKKIRAPKARGNFSFLGQMSYLPKRHAKSYNTYIYYTITYCQFIFCAPKARRNISFRFALKQVI